MKLNLEAMTKAGIDVDAIKDFIEHRKTIKKPLTQRALEMNMREAWKAKKLGITPEQAIDYTIFKCWIGVNCSHMSDRINEVLELFGEEPVKKQSTRSMSLSENLNDRSWANKVVKLENNS